MFSWVTDTQFLLNPSLSKSGLGRAGPIRAPVDHVHEYERHWTSFSSSVAPMLPQPDEIRSPLSTDAVTVAGNGVTARLLEETQINKYHVPKGHGFSAEDANTLHDRWRGRSVEQVGKENTLNGADRLVDGVAIQSKYCASASETIRSAFSDDGNYRYTGQVLEVPSDQHEACVRLMRAKILAGKVPGVTDPNQAESLVRKGSVTYRQAVNIAKAGTVDGIWFDIKTHAVTCGAAATLSFLIAFAHAKWSGEETPQATKDALWAAGGVGAATMLTGVATSQILRTKSAAVMRVGARKAVKAVHNTKVGKTLVSKLASASLGKAVGGGAAINHVAKLARSNAVTSTVSVVVMSTPDVYRAMIDRSVSWQQVGKNLTVRVAGTVGGVGGWMGGAIVGASAGSVVPVIGTAAGGIIGGVVGSLGGGTLASYGSKKMMDKLCSDDADRMLRLMPEPLSELASDYMLFEDEMEKLGAIVQTKTTPAFLRSMFKATNRHAFLKTAFEGECQALVRQRPRVSWEPAAG